MAMWPDTTPKSPEDPAGQPPLGAPPGATSQAAPPSRGPTREYRATWTFTLAAAFLLFAYIVILMQVGGSAGGVFLSGVLGIAINVVAAYGLSDSRAWARYAMTPILWIYVGAGLLVFLVALSRNSINIPIGAILAAWSLAAKPSAALGPVPASSMEGTLLVVATIVAALIQFL